MAGDSEVNNPPVVVPCQELSIPEIQKVQHKLKSKTKSGGKQKQYQKQRKVKKSQK